MILGVDPGSQKSGLAVLDQEGRVHFQGIVETDIIRQKAAELLDRFPVEVIVLGNGTHSSQVLEVLEGLTTVPVRLVDEAYTTFAAEQRYRRENLSGVKRILRFINWKPSRPLDDYVAVILAERYLEEQQDQNS